MSPAAAEARAQMVPILAARRHRIKGPEAASWEQEQESLRAGERKEEERLTGKLGRSRKCGWRNEARGEEKQRSR